MNVHHNDLENLIDDPKYFHHHWSWLLSGNDGNKLKKKIQVSTAQLYVI